MELNSTFVMTAQDLEAELLEVRHDILISDLHLGDDYAPDLLKRLRLSDVENKDIPIIFLSGDPVDLHPALKELSNWTYLLKPVNPRELSLKVREMLKLNLQNTLPAVDLTTLSNAAAHDTKFMKELIDVILSTLPDELDKINLLVCQDKLFEATKLLHKIKPSISYFGISELLEERNLLHDKARKSLEIKEEFEVFKTRVNIALESLAAQKNQL
jgi:response regulator RpfG family c-di-GMP phosphodiesterase